jgi:hypothetical protein
MDKSKLTIQRPEGIPEWAEIGVMVMVRLMGAPLWEGPYPLQGYDFDDGTFRVDGKWWSEAKPYIRWQPEPEEWVAFWDECDNVFSIGVYQEQKRTYDALLHRIKNITFTWQHVARLVDDDGNPIDLRCTVEELKERTVWL